MTRLTGLWVLFGLLFVVGFVAAQPPPIPHGPTVTRYTGWELSRVFPGWSFEYKDGQCVGAARRDFAERFTYDPRTMRWFEAAPRVGVSEDPGITRNEGIDTGEMDKVRPAYRAYDGKTVRVIDRDEALRILGSPDSDRIPNDKDKPWLIAVGSPETLKRIAADLEQAPQLKAKVRYQGYTPDQWRAKQPDLQDVQNSPQFRSTGLALFIATHDGRLVHGQWDYQTGDLQVLGQKFDPARLPDLRLPERVGESIVDQFFKRVKEEPILWLVGGAILVLLIRRPEPK